LSADSVDQCGATSSPEAIQRRRGGRLKRGLVRTDFIGGCRWPWLPYSRRPARPRHARRRAGSTAPNRHRPERARSDSAWRPDHLIVHARADPGEIQPPIRFGDRLGVARRGFLQCSTGNAQGSRAIVEDAASEGQYLEGAAIRLKALLVRTLREALRIRSTSVSSRIRSLRALSLMNEHCPSNAGLSTFSSSSVWSTPQPAPCVSSPKVSACRHHHEAAKAAHVALVCVGGQLGGANRAGLPSREVRNTTPPPQ
jgi:hypothetical protein